MLLSATYTGHILKMFCLKHNYNQTTAYILQEPNPGAEKHALTTRPKHTNANNVFLLCRYCQVVLIILSNNGSFPKFSEYLDDYNSYHDAKASAQPSSILLRSSTLLILKSIKILLSVMVGLVWVWLECQSMVPRLGSILMDHCLLTPCTRYFKDFTMNKIWSTLVIFFLQPKRNRKTTLTN